MILKVNPANGSSAIIASMCALLGSLCYAFNGNYLEKFHSNSNKKVLIGWSMLFGGLFMTPFAFFNLPDAIPNLNSFLALLWLAVVSTGIGYLGYIRLINRIGAVKTSTLTYFTPVFSIIWGAIFLQEKDNVNHFGRFSFCYDGNVLCQYNQSKKN